MSFDKLTPNQKIQAANIDCMRHHKFALLSGVICMGKSEVKDDIPTACTDGKNKYYGAAFIEGKTRAQIRYVVLHENFHVALKHCVLPIYIQYVKKFGPQICNVAMDFVVNGMIEELDPELKFVERPTEHMCIDEKYEGMSFPQVLQDLLKDAEQQPQDGDGQQSLDDHIMSPVNDDGSPMTPDQVEKLGKMIDDANRQGELLVRKMRGEGKGGRDLLGTAVERTTNWRDALVEFINSVCQGDEQSRFCPPNKRLLASGFVMPSHFDENMGELIIACDTSGSMHWCYPIVFGEIARIAQHAKPDSVRILWWDTEVCGEQEFKPHEYESIAKSMAPKGGGGTTVSCVADYIAEHKLTPKAVIYLTDGWIEHDYRVPQLPLLWGLVDNDDYTPHTGKVVRIQP
jgi:predicted metal-dependent peptidase